MTRREIDPNASTESTSLGTSHEPAHMRETLSSVAKLANIIADVADGRSDRDLHGRRGQAPAAHARDRRGAPSIAFGTRAFDTTPLEAIGAAFDELRDTIPDVKEKTAAVLADVVQSEDLADKIDEIVRPIEERLLEVAWQSHEVSCQTPADLRIKAEILRFVASDEPDDIQSVLTRSLCDDIIARTTRRSDADA